MKVLVVDDEQDMQTLFQQRFRKEIRDGKVDFAFAISGEQALEYMKENDHEEDRGGEQAQYQKFP